MLTDVVYKDLRDKILSLTLKPGTPLSFTNLKPLYNVSISPIRDALKHLENEGLVTIRPQSGTSVALIDMAKVRDERFRRLYLELGAVEKAFDRGIGSRLISEIETNIVQQKKAFDSMLDTSGNYHRIRMVSYLFDDIFSNAIDQHETILNALKAESMDLVMQLERNHISKMDIETSGYQKAYPQYFKSL